MRIVEEPSYTIQDAFEDAFAGAERAQGLRGSADRLANALRTSGTRDLLGQSPELRDSLESLRSALDEVL